MLFQVLYGFSLKVQGDLYEANVKDGINLLQIESEKQLSKEICFLVGCLT